jgi:ribosome maturation factor RimP
MTTQTTTENQRAPTAAETGAKLSPQDRMIELLAPIIETLGYELVHVELQNHRTKTLRLYIDQPATDETAATSVGIEDCVKVTKGLDEPLEKLTEIDKLFGGTYELEVSSPGVDRPLRKAKDFNRFTGRDVRIHTFRPLTADELANTDYQKRNPKQKNYLGILEGFDDGRASVKLAVLASMGAAKTIAKKGAKKKKGAEEPKKDHILIPMTLIAKANIEPDFDVSDEF